MQKVDLFFSFYFFFFFFLSFLISSEVDKVFGNVQVGPQSNITLIQKSLIEKFRGISTFFDRKNSH